MFKIACDWCPKYGRARYGQFRTVTLVAKFGTAIHPVKVAEHLADCPDALNLSKPRKMGRRGCRLYFPDYVEGTNPVLPWRPRSK